MEEASPEMEAFTGTIEEQCSQFGSILGINGPVSEEVLFAAVHDPSYAHNLLSARKSEMFLNYLLGNPPKPDATIEEEQAAEGTHTNMELAKKAGHALWKWARAGFATVEDEIYRKRMNACMACPHSQSKPDKLLYNALSKSTAASDGVSEKICGKCGCMLSKKTKLPTESCPDRHPELAGLTRWEEPITI